MPNYNNADWLEKSIGSVLDQSFEHYNFVFIDDNSTDGSSRKAERLIGDRGTVLSYKRKLWNGGARNAGIALQDGEKYTLFLDSDDWLSDSEVLQDLYDFIMENDCPDCVRLPYTAVYDGNKTLDMMLAESSPEKLVESIFVACWTKCIKSDLIQLFPDNTLMEDVVQHIKQCDVLNTVEPFYRQAVIYNRNNPKSCSIEGNQDLQHGKWQSSMFRYMADLLDLELDHEYSKKQRDWRAEICLNNIKNDKYTQSVE